MIPSSDVIWPSRSFLASGSQFALLPPDNATGNFTKVVQRIPVKIALGDTILAAKLRPGLSVTAFVRTRE
jgi:membrane fusion protein, multidrug efflux system